MHGSRGKPTHIYVKYGQCQKAFGSQRHAFSSKYLKLVVNCISEDEIEDEEQSATVLPLQKRAGLSEKGMIHSLCQ